MPLTHGRPRPFLPILAIAVLAAGAAALPQAALGASRPAMSHTDRANVTGARPFQKTSYWNTRLGHAPRDPHSGAWIRDSEQNNQFKFLRLVLGDYAMPVYHARPSDPMVTISSGGHTVRFHVPRAAHPMPTGDAALTVIDRSTNQVVGLFGAHVSKRGWSVSGLSRYGFQSGGIAGGLPGGAKSNFGHRGIPASVPAVTKAEIQRGKIRHRLEVYWHETASSTPEGQSAYFPMTGSEGGKNGVVPEGAVIRIRPGVNLKGLHLSRAAYVVARALQKYGAVVGDNAGQGNSLKLQANTNWSGILGTDSLHAIPWSDYVFVKGGYRP